MENLELDPEKLKIEELGEPKIESPLKLSTVYGDNIANYVRDEESVVFYNDKSTILERLKKNLPILSFEKAGPRQKIYFDPSKMKVGIVTCGGLCPGINNVIRALVYTLFYRYGVKRILGFRYGYRGFIPKYGYEPIDLTPEVVESIHEKGGSFLSSSRGHQDVGEIVDCLDRMNISILFTIGGDGTLRGARDIHNEIKKRGLKISIIGIPKTIDNDISYVEKTFGLETAFSVAAEAIKSAHVEAVGAPYGIGIVKVMGRMSGFIAANAALAMSEVNFVLIPEVPFDLEGPKGLFNTIEKRLRERGHVVIIVAEGAGQQYVNPDFDRKDISGNPILGDIGMFLKTEIKKYFKENTELYVNIKYIDPSYLVRAVPANAHDSIYCIQLAQSAVHAGMAGKTGMLVGIWNGVFTHVPIELAVSQRKYLSPEDPLWLSVLEATGQPIRMVND
ncbi:MAG: ATP-dependent 6-phosphofructokinase [Spirochaetes bacterium]|nr:MAG: ATP-dependent 6-phosphofructokinase [Spirochaetota bacterium]RKY03009.1 MAG: ATP-dependent 6-phosphofructokinase [Spirochaetota bacterium]